MELVLSLLFAAVMVPIVMASMIGLIYGFGELCNIISNVGHSEKDRF